MPLALGIETSCDDGSVSLVNHKGEVLFIANKDQNLTHQAFGGIVPELAGRQQEMDLLPLIEQALKQCPPSEIDLVAVASRPGLLGSLIMGCLSAKTLSLCWKKPLVGVNHIEAHIFSPLLFFPEKRKLLPKKLFPALGFVVSGGHSSLFLTEEVGQSTLLGETRDDSAGEAFDKLAKMLGLGWPGGPVVDRLAQKADKEKRGGRPFFSKTKTETTRPDELLQTRRRESSFFSKIKTDDLSFSFSGIKSQAQRLISRLPSLSEYQKAELCLDWQTKTVDHLMDKFSEAFELHPFKVALIGGGVSANSYFRSRLVEWSQKTSVPCLFPEKSFCSDNGAMIALTGLKYFLKGKTDDLNMPCSPRHFKEDFFKTNSFNRI